MPVLRPCLALLLAGSVPLAALTAQDKPRLTKTKTKTAAPTEEWTSYRGNPAMHGVAPGTLGDKFELAWSFQTGDAILSSPVVWDDTVYFGSSDQNVYALDLATGKKKWAYKTEDIVDAPPLVLDGRVYIGSSDFFLYALDAKTGKLAWKFETQDKILGAANYARMKDGTTRLLVGSYDSNLYCFDAKSGKKLWSYETGHYINGSPAIQGDHVIFGGCDAVLHVVSIQTGKKVKEVELGADCHVAGSVAIADDHVFFGHYGNAFISVNLKEIGKPAWVHTSRQAFFAAPSILKDRVIFGGRDKKLHCVGRKEGKPLWSFPTKRKIDGSPLVCGDKVVFGSGDGRLYLLNVNTGKLVWKYEIGRPIFSSPAIAKGMIFIGSNDDHLYAFRPVKGQPAASKGQPAASKGQPQ